MAQLKTTDDLILTKDEMITLLAAQYPQYFKGRTEVDITAVRIAFESNDEFVFTFTSVIS